MAVVVMPAAVARRRKHRRRLGIRRPPACKQPTHRRWSRTSSPTVVMAGAHIEHIRHESTRPGSASLFSVCGSAVVRQRADQEQTGHYGHRAWSVAHAASRAPPRRGDGLAIPAIRTPLRHAVMQHARAYTRAKRARTVQAYMQYMHMRVCAHTLIRSPHECPSTPAGALHTRPSCSHA